MGCQQRKPCRLSKIYRLAFKSGFTPNGHAMLNPLSDAVWSKIDEQADLLAGIVASLPQGQLHWVPPFAITKAPPPRPLGRALGHLLQCLAGFLAVLYAVHPERLGHFLELKRRRVNHLCRESECLERIAEYRRLIQEGFTCLTDRDLADLQPTVFVTAGEPVLTLLLGNLEHLVNHKHELFMYAKWMGVPLVSRNLYRFRPEADVQSEVVSSCVADQPVVVTASGKCADGDNS
jgi:DinB superfamily